MATRYRSRKYHLKVRARVRESERTPEPVWAMEMDQVMDQARMEIWAPAISRLVVAGQTEGMVTAAALMVVGGMDSAADFCKELMFYLNRNRSTPKTRVRIRSRERLC